MSPTGLVIKLGHKLEEATIQEKTVAGRLNSHVMGMILIN